MIPDASTSMSSFDIAPITRFAGRGAAIRRPRVKLHINDIPFLM